LQRYHVPERSDGVHGDVIKYFLSAERRAVLHAFRSTIPYESIHALELRGCGAMATTPADRAASDELLKERAGVTEASRLVRARVCREAAS
jgi:hypothetical protein